MTDEPIKDRDDSPEPAIDDESSETSAKEPWAKISSGDKDKIASDDDD